MDDTCNSSHTLTPPDNTHPPAANERNNWTDLIADWSYSLSKHTSSNVSADPNYFANDSNSLVTSSHVHSFQVGTGDSIFAETLTRIENAQSEVLFVTCFWARSPSLERLSKSLKILSRKSLHASDSGAPKIRVRIGFSSRSLCQKLLQTGSLQGYVYPPEQWESKLGLPPPEELSGLDLEIKSVFVRPFSVMHPKFVCLDRQLVFLPSCNVSWEEWFEGCLSLSGPVVNNFIKFWHEFWGRGSRELPPLPPFQSKEDPVTTLNRRLSVVQELPPWLSYLNSTAGESIPTVFLPSPHHVNPRFRPIPCLPAAQPPPTPLNLFLQRLFKRAKFSIYIQTPNLTCPWVLKAILGALARGVDVDIVTSERLMILEQLGTAATTTGLRLRSLVGKYMKLPTETPIYDTERDPPGHPTIRGRLHIEYYQPRSGAPKPEPVQSHLKLTIVDEEFVVLGSGNMDRASWYTSQELGVAFWSTDLAAELFALVRKNLEGRLKLFFPRTGTLTD
ncbi:phospholipase d transphosphatidylase [Diplodia corticola]|uniref:Phospholipase d transphosphatidylase n=1 Tax=Diplodia corticola TaxID=236234 RepID=A0A1J9R0E4_9PEZI|nr:phospholipase d transphosphatidylase [Diplodia corticola]OJD34065.1 phospholipase d transphosphatidylase [Diplodia corticola]